MIDTNVKQKNPLYIELGTPNKHVNNFLQLNMKFLYTSV